LWLINRDGSTVADVSVASGVVTWGTFCGGHNSQFADNSQPEIERGTVISSIDELVEWRTVRWTQTVTETREINGEFQQVEIDLPKQADYYGAEPVGAVFTDDDGNEKTVHAKQADQLPKCEISTVEGDKMVYGTFSHYDDNGTPIIHSLGQTVVRVAGPIEAGDLLMSKGDGTACKWVESYGYAAILGKCRQGAPNAAQNDVNLLAYTSMAG
jgi:predicted oxidoreductase